MFTLMVSSQGFPDGCFWRDQIVLRHHGVTDDEADQQQSEDPLYHAVRSFQVGYHPENADPCQRNDPEENQSAGESDTFIINGSGPVSEYVVVKKELRKKEKRNNCSEDQKHQKQSYGNNPAANGEQIPARPAQSVSEKNAEGRDEYPECKAIGINTSGCEITDYEGNGCQVNSRYYPQDIAVTCVSAGSKPYCDRSAQDTANNG